MSLFLKSNLTVSCRRKMKIPLFLNLKNKGEKIRLDRKFTMQFYSFSAIKLFEAVR
jgi:hypothetical protein